MNYLVALYARVSSGKQIKDQTIGSQLASLRDKITNDGYRLNKNLEFIDEGYSGSVLVRPALEKLRDAVNNGEISKVYVHSPDRLARKYAYQILLLEEFKGKSVEIIFLNHAFDDNPESKLLLQMQGMIAEYERAKILERSRRGKLYAAKKGLVSVLGSAPYGYKYINKHEGAGEARWDINEHEATIIRHLFVWIGNERMSIGKACRRLERMGELTKRGNSKWDRAVVWSMLKNPAYKGKAAFGKTKMGEIYPRNRPPKHSRGQFRTTYSVYHVDKEDWIEIPVPSIIDEDLFELVQNQLDHNRKKSRVRETGKKYLLQGLAVCPHCQYAYCGKTINKVQGKGRKNYIYSFYRCTGVDINHLNEHKICDNKPINSDIIETIVWEEINLLLQQPERIMDAYKFYINEKKLNSEENSTKIKDQIHKLNQSISRLIDTYTDELITKEEFGSKIKILRQRLTVTNGQNDQLSVEKNLEEKLDKAIMNLSMFKENITTQLSQTDWKTKQMVISLLIKRVEIGKEQINVVFKINPPPCAKQKQSDDFPYCWEGTYQR